MEYYKNISSEPQQLSSYPAFTLLEQDEAQDNANPLFMDTLRYANSFVQVDIAVLEDLVLSPTAKVLMCLFYFIADPQNKKVCVSVGHLVKLLNREKRTIFYTLKELKTRGVLKIKNQYIVDADGQPRQTASLYTIVGRYAPCYRDRKPSNFYFAKVDLWVLLSKDLTLEEKCLYAISCAKRNVITNECTVYYSTFSKLMGKSVEVVKNTFKKLQFKNLVQIKKNICINVDGLQQHMAPTFTIGGATDSAAISSKTNILIKDINYNYSHECNFLASPPKENCRANSLNDSLTKDTVTPTLATNPSVDNFVNNPQSLSGGNRKNDYSYNKKASKHTSLVPLTEAPSSLRPLATYLLKLSNRPDLRATEIPALEELESRHTPDKLRETIDSAFESFKKRGKSFIGLGWEYIAAKLKYQFSKPAYASEQIESTFNNGVSPTYIEELRNLIPQISESDLETKTLESFSQIDIHKFSQSSSELISLAKDIEYQKSASQDTSCKSQADLQEEAIAYVQQKFPDVENIEGILKFTISKGLRKIQDILNVKQSEHICSNCRGLTACPYGGYKPQIRLDSLIMGNAPFIWTGSETERCDLQPCPENHNQMSLQKRRFFYEAFKDSGLKIEDLTKTFDSINTNELSPAIAFVKAQAMLSAQKGTWLMFLGSSDVNISYLCNAIILYKLWERKSARVFTADALLDNLKQGFSDHTFEEKLSRIKSADCLIIKDLGKNKLSEWAVKTLKEIIDFRYEQKLTTVFSTLCTPQDLITKNPSLYETFFLPLVSYVTELGIVLNFELSGALPF